VHDRRAGSAVYAVLVSTITGRPESAGDWGVAERRERDPPAAPFAPTLALTVTLLAAGFLLLMSVTLLLVHPSAGYLGTTIIRQNQSAKSALYVAAFVLLLPGSILAGVRLADRIVAGSNSPALAVLVPGLAAALLGILILIRVLPGHHGLRSIAVGVGAWWLLAAGLLFRTARPSPWPALRRVSGLAPAAWVLAALAAFGGILCVTSLGSLSGVGLVAGGLGALIVVLAWGNVSPPALGRFAGRGLDLAVVVLLLAAITNVVVYHASSAVPNGIFPPGVIQFQQDWILGPTNQLFRGGGALLVNDPSSQYGVGLVYFLAAWFHIAPLNYGTFGLLDGILTGLMYIGGYLALRMAGVSRLLAVAALALGVTAFIYHLQYPVGSLPEEGPLRFGLPIIVIVALVAGAARPRSRRAAQALALVAVGIGSVWAIEAFAYTTFTYLIMVALEGRLRSAGKRLRWTLAQVGLAVAACVTAHIVLALATLAGSGHLPRWSQYLAYVHGLLLGGREGTVTYGFANWSPGLAVGAGCLASAAALVLLVARRPELARRELRTVLALAGSTAYAVASFSYVDNRSSTYLFLYVALPLLMAATLWLKLILDDGQLPLLWRRAALAAALPAVVVMLAAAWSTVGGEFSQSALARAYPSGGLSSALHRLWHAPPIDPRAPAAAELLARYVPGRRPLILLPDAPDLGLETQMRSGKAGLLFLADPAEDMWIPSVWMPRIGRQIAALRPGTRILTDVAALRMAPRLRALHPRYSVIPPLGGGNPELEWILRRLTERFRLVPIHRGPGEFVVASLALRAGPPGR
jgi:hypothetical protein